jgi:Adenylate cyclase, class 2 (thermophilic)
MIEVELKSVVDDIAARRALVERAGGVLVFGGRLEDRRYDTADGALAARDHVMRLRVYVSANARRAELDWKGPTRIDDGYKLREELGTPVGDADALIAILGHLGYVVTTEIDREIAQYELGGTTIRFERYPRMDDLVEVEGEPRGIERAIAVLGLPRDGFTSERLTDFARRYARRSGRPAATSDSELARLEATE